MPNRIKTYLEGLGATWAEREARGNVPSFTNIYDPKRNTGPPTQQYDYSDVGVTPKVNQSWLYMPDEEWANQSNKGITMVDVPKTQGVETKQMKQGGIERITEESVRNILKKRYRVNSIDALTRKQYQEFAAGMNRWRKAISDEDKARNAAAKEAREIAKEKRDYDRVAAKEAEATKLARDKFNWDKLKPGKNIEGTWLDKERYKKLAADLNEVEKKLEGYNPTASDESFAPTGWGRLGLTTKDDNRLANEEFYAPYIKKKNKLIKEMADVEKRLSPGYVQTRGLGNTGQGVPPPVQGAATSPATDGLNVAPNQPVATPVKIREGFSNFAAEGVAKGWSDDEIKKKWATKRAGGSPDGNVSPEKNEAPSPKATKGLGGQGYGLRADGTKNGEQRKTSSGVTGSREDQKQTPLSQMAQAPGMIWKGTGPLRSGAMDALKTVGLGMSSPDTEISDQDATQMLAQIQKMLVNDVPASQQIQGIVNLMMGL